MTYKVTYQFLDKNKQIIKEYEDACFSGTNYQYENHEDAVYFKYIVNNKCTKEQGIEYIRFLNSIRWFDNINVNQFIFDNSYIFKIKSKNSLRTFATLTALRYLDENKEAVIAILKNKDNRKISRMKLLLLLGAMFTINTGHNLNKVPTDVKEFIKAKIPKYKGEADDKIWSSGLNDLFKTTRIESWCMGIDKENTFKAHYGLIL